MDLGNEALIYAITLLRDKDIEAIDEEDLDSWSLIFRNARERYEKYHRMKSVDEKRIYLSVVLPIISLHYKQFVHDTRPIHASMRRIEDVARIVVAKNMQILDINNINDCYKDAILQWLERKTRISSALLYMIIMDNEKFYNEVNKMIIFENLRVERNNSFFGDFDELNKMDHVELAKEYFTRVKPLPPEYMALVRDWTNFILKCNRYIYKQWRTSSGKRYLYELIGSNIENHYAIYLPSITQSLGPVHEIIGFLDIFPHRKIMEYVIFRIYGSDIVRRYRYKGASRRKRLVPISGKIRSPEDLFPKNKDMGILTLDLKWLNLKGDLIISGDRSEVSDEIMLTLFQAGVSNGHIKIE